MRADRVKTFKKKELKRLRLVERLREIEADLEKRWDKLLPHEKDQIDNWNGEEEPEIQELAELLSIPRRPSQKKALTRNPPSGILFFAGR